VKLAERRLRGRRKAEVRRLRKGSGLSEQLFTVWQVSSDDSQVIAAEGLPAKIAVDYAHWLMQTQEARDGEIQRITITNEGNYTVFEWKFGEGLTFQIPDIGALQ